MSSISMNSPIDDTGGNRVALAALAVGVAAVACAVAGLLLYRDGEPDFPVFLSAFAAPIGVVLGIIGTVRGVRGAGRTGTAVAGGALSALVAGLWLWGLIGIVTGPL